VRTKQSIFVARSTAEWKEHVILAGSYDVAGSEAKICLDLDLRSFSLKGDQTVLIWFIVKHYILFWNKE
jgi:hypothetical protein